MKTGIELITEKREKQITKYGYDADHDKQHSVRDFLDAAYTYMYIKKDAWPFPDGLKWGDEVENLTNAGAMIAASIDLIQGNGNGLQSKSLEWAKDDPLTNPDFEDINT